MAGSLQAADRPQAAGAGHPDLDRLRGAADGVRPATSTAASCRARANRGPPRAPRNKWRRPSGDTPSKPGSRLNSTAKSVQGRLGRTKNLAAYWDDIQDERHQESLFQTMFVATGGAEGGRLNPDSSYKERKEWQTLLVACTNASFVEYPDQEAEVDHRRHAPGARVRVQQERQTSRG